jgi:hypothetical protein
LQKLNGPDPAFSPRRKLEVTQMKRSKAGFLA